MYTTAIYSTIFKKDTVSQRLAHHYAHTGQEDVGLEWVSRHSYRIGMLLAYLCVHKGPDEACASLVEAMTEYIDGSVFDTTRIHALDKEVISVETVNLLNYIISTDLNAEEYLCYRLIEEIKDTPLTEEALYLIDVDSI